MSDSDLGVRHLCRGIVTNLLGLHCDMSTGRAPHDESEHIKQFLGALAARLSGGRRSSTPPTPMTTGTRNGPSESFSVGIRNFPSN